MDIDHLLQAARQAATRARARYSHFPVGAAVETVTGHIYLGCNIESASYGLTICAERNAAAAMALASPHDRGIDLVAVFSPDASPCFPCGACRQVLREFGCKEVVVEEASGLRRYPFEQILPHSFGPETLR